jgi:hypothetical protein
MNPTIKLIAAFAVGFAIPATAATGQAWYPVQDIKAKKCAVIEKKPGGGASAVFGTRVEAPEITRAAGTCATD